MIIHKSNFIEIIYEKQHSLIIHQFTSVSDNMKTADFKKEMQIFAGMCEKHKPQKELANFREMKFVIIPELQEWMNKEILSRYKNIINQIAIVSPTELFASVALEQTMEEEIGEEISHRFFENEKTAREWLLKNDK